MKFQNQGLMGLLTLRGEGETGQLCACPISSRSLGVSDLWDRSKHEVKRGCLVYLKFLIDDTILIHISKYAK